MKMRLLMFVSALAASALIAVAQSDQAKTEFKAAHEKMMNAMMAGMSGDPDKDFVMMMIPHHQGAIDMAKIELQYGKDPVLRSLAEKIIAAQESEITEMRKWQSEHGM